MSAGIPAVPRIRHDVNRLTPQKVGVLTVSSHFQSPLQRTHNEGVLAVTWPGRDRFTPRWGRCTCIAVYIEIQPTHQHVFDESRG